MKPFVALLVGCWLLCGHQARAERLDFSAFTCKRFLESQKNQMDIIRAWLDGYYREEDDPPIFDTDKLEADGKKLLAYCAAHPGVDLITAADEVYGK